MQICNFEKKTLIKQLLYNLNNYFFHPEVVCEDLPQVANGRLVRIGGGGGGVRGKKGKMKRETTNGTATAPLVASPAKPVVRRRVLEFGDVLRLECRPGYEPAQQQQVGAWPSTVATGGTAHHHFGGVMPPPPSPPPTVVRCLANRTVGPLPLPRCVDVDECAQHNNNMNNCEPLSSECRNTAGGYECRCRQGFRPPRACGPVGTPTASGRLVPVQVKK